MTTISSRKRPTRYNITNRVWSLLYVIWMAIGAANTRAEIVPGAPREQVIRELGEPRSKMSLGRNETLIYPNGTEVILKDGRVERVTLPRTSPLPKAATGAATGPKPAASVPAPAAAPAAIGASPSSPGSGIDELQRAVMLQQPAQVKTLLEKGVNPNELFGTGKTSHIAETIQDKACFDLLLARGMKIREQDHYPLLSSAAFYGRTFMVEYLLDRGLDINGLDPNRPDPRNPPAFPPLHQAALGAGGVSNNGRPVKENDDTVRLLLKRGADIHFKNRNGSTALQGAAGSCGTSVLKILLDAGADPNAQDVFGLTPLHKAAIRDWATIVELLVEKGANPNLQNKRGQSALHEAVQQRQVNIVRALLAKGARTDLKDAGGKTPVDLLAGMKDDDKKSQIAALFKAR